MLLNSTKFDVLRGWPHGSAIDQCFAPKVSGGSPVSLPAGTVVAVQSDGTVDKASTPNVTTTDPVQVWVVFEGNDDFSAKFVGKVNCLQGELMLRLDPANFVAGTWTPGKPVSFNAGQFRLAAANDQIVGQVVEDDTATDGTVVITFNGLMTGVKH